MNNDAVYNNVVNHIDYKGDIVFYTIDDVIKMTHWSRQTVQKLFNDPAFPYTDFGRQKLVTNVALIEYFSVQRKKSNERHWRKDVERNGKRNKC